MNNNMNELTSEERKLILQERMAWRDMFSSASGKVAFRRMARELYFYNDDLTVENPEGMARNNYFKCILERLGVSDNPEMTTNAVSDAILDALLKLPLTVKEDETET